MGQQCVREGSDDEGAVDHKKNEGKQNSTQDSKSKAKGNKYAASERIISLEHVEHPHARMCDAARIEKGFREFSRLFTMGEAALCVASCDTYGPGHKQLITGGEDKSMSILNYETGHVMKQWKRAHDRDINCITNPHPSSGVFLTGSRDTTVRVWKPTESAPLHILKGHKLNVASVTVNEPGTMACSGSRDNTVRLWDLESGEQLSSQDVKLNLVHFVRWIDPLGCVAQGGEDLTLRLWDVRTDGGKKSSLELRETFANFDYHPICCDGLTTQADRAHTLYTGHNGFNNQGSMIYEWDLRTGKRVRQLNGHGFTVRAVHLLRSEAFQRVGLANHLVSASEDGTLRFWPLAHGAAAGKSGGEVVDPVDVQAAEVAVPADAAASSADDAVVQDDQSLNYELQEGRVTGLDETKEGLLLCSLRNGTLVILKPSGSEDAPRPMQRFRYVGNPAATS
ncbi:Hypothetical protein, putative [Bodo saltans]|uniref:Uncharacterized protein n=1 Tax=Bodo saltans TaxID=75058 RepID=A0A0S4J1I0_BODSA|nr:Hypothetical protein, putative [Bodo saltans]|eukprot:CUG55100.1 Hypothetical protein, putative [Bodo saltans]